MQLLTQMFASVTYIQTRHPYGKFEGQPDLAPAPLVASSSAPNSAVVPTSAVSLTNGNAAQHSVQGGQQQPPERPATPPPENPTVFNAALRELAQDLVIKEQQIEYLINSLPGIGNSEADQEKRMKELEGELKTVEAERLRAEEDRERMVDVLGQVIVGASKVT